jgi:hypothetical protein
LVDAEVKRILDEAYVRARKTLEENRELLQRIAEALLERETLDREEVDLLAAGKPLPELKTTKPTGLPANPPTIEPPDRAPSPSPLGLGPQVAPKPA